MRKRSRLLSAAASGLNSVGMVRRSATLNLGIAMLAEEIVDDDLADRRLRRMLRQWQATPIAVYAITRRA